jgi:hypothetical protein
VKEDIIKALDDLLFHFLNCCHMPYLMEIKLCSAPILLNKVKFTMIFWIKVAQMATLLNQLLKLGLLKHEIRLQKQKASVTAVSVTREALKILALGEKINISLGPQTILLNDDLHALEPARHRGIIFRKIEWLRFAI